MRYHGDEAMYAFSIFNANRLRPSYSMAAQLYCIIPHTISVGFVSLSLDSHADTDTHPTLNLHSHHVSVQMWTGCSIRRHFNLEGNEVCV